MIVNRSDKFIFVAVPRTASTTIKLCLDARKNVDHPPEIYHATISDILEKQEEELKKYYDEPNRRANICFANPNKAGPDIVYADIEREPVNEYYKFAFVRNPWDRFVSSYFEFRQKEQHPWAEEIANFETFDEFLFAFPNLKINNDIHFKSQRHFLVKQAKSFNSAIIESDLCKDKDEEGSLFMNFIGRYENLQKDFEKICKNIGMKSFLLSERVKLRNGGRIPREMAKVFKKGHYSQYYRTEAHVNVIADFYKEDIENFGYEFTRPGFIKGRRGRKKNDLVFCVPDNKEAATWSFDSKKKNKTRIKRGQVALLISGRADSRSINNLSIYKDFSDVVISAWEDDPDIGHIHKFAPMCLPKCKTVANKPIHGRVSDYLSKHSDPSGTFYYQCVVNFMGLKEISSQYVVKVRSDEYFSNLYPLIEKSQNGNKFVAGNAFWRPAHPGGSGLFHIGDHVFFAETKYLLSAYESMVRSFEANKIPILHLNERNGTSFYINCPTLPEACLALHYLEAKGFDMKDVQRNEYEYLTNNFDVVNMNELGDYWISNKHTKTIWKTGQFPGPELDTNGKQKTLSILPSCHIEVIIDNISQVINGSVEIEHQQQIKERIDKGHSVEEYVKRNYQVSIKHEE